MKKLPQKAGYTQGKGLPFRASHPGHRPTNPALQAGAGASLGHLGGCPAQGPVRNENVLLGPICEQTPVRPSSLLSDTPSTRHGRDSGGAHGNARYYLSRDSQTGGELPRPWSRHISTGAHPPSISPASHPHSGHGALKRFSMETRSGDLRHRPNITPVQTCFQMFSWGEREARSPDWNKYPCDTSQVHCGHQEPRAERTPRPDGVHRLQAGGRLLVLRALN